MVSTHRSRIFVFSIAVLGVVACGSDSKPPAKTAGRCAEMAAKVGFAGAKTGITTGVEGVKTAGKAVGGFVEGGSEGAQREWQQGKVETKRIAHDGADEVKRASSPSTAAPCDATPARDEYGIPTP